MCWDVWLWGLAHDVPQSSGLRHEAPPRHPRSLPVPSETSCLWIVLGRVRTCSFAAPLAGALRAQLRLRGGVSCVAQELQLCPCHGCRVPMPEAGRKAGRALQALELLLMRTTPTVSISKPAPGVVQRAEETRELPEPTPRSPALTPVSFLSSQGRSFWRRPQTNSRWRRRRSAAGCWARSWRARGSSMRLGARGWTLAALAGWPMAASATPSSPLGNAAAGPCRASKPSSSSATRRDSPMPRADTMRTASEVKRGPPRPAPAPGQGSAGGFGSLQAGPCVPGGCGVPAPAHPCAKRWA